MNANTLVYFIRPVGLVGPVKIGVSASPQERLGQLMTWSPYPLEIAVAIPGGQDLERNIHQCLAEHHSHREWFHPTAKVIGLVEKLVAGVPIERAIDLNDRRGRLFINRPPRTKEMSKYMSLRARMDGTLNGFSRRSGSRVFWNHEAYDIRCALTCWAGRSQEPVGLACKVERILRTPSSFITETPYWDRRSAQPSPDHKQGATPAPDMGGCA